MSKRALVTGANRGLGLEFVRQFCERGYRVFATCRQPSEALEKLPCEIVELDVSDEASIARCRATVGERTDALDILVNNAGIPHSGEWEHSEGFGTLNMAGLTKVFQVNAAGPLLVTQAFADLLEKGECPRIASVSSAFSSMGLRNGFYACNFAYSSSKASINIFMLSLAFLLKERGILTVSVDPGWARTDMGGPDATLSPEEAVVGMIKVIDQLCPETSGLYIDYRGERLPW